MPQSSYVRDRIPGSDDADRGDCPARNLEQKRLEPREAEAFDDEAGEVCLERDAALLEHQQSASPGVRPPFPIIDMPDDSQDDLDVGERFEGLVSSEHCISANQRRAPPRV